MQEISNHTICSYVFYVANTNCRRPYQVISNISYIMIFRWRPPCPALNTVENRAMYNLWSASLRCCPQHTLNALGFA